MKISIKIIISAFIISAVAVCKLPPIKYVTVTPPSIDIPAKNQPVKVTVNDSRKKSEASPTIFEEQFPDKTVQNIIKERLEKNNIKLSDMDNAGEFIITINTFKAVDTGGFWNAHVSLTFTNDIRTQNVETKIKLYNGLGARDAVKALSQALSAALDDIKWNEFFPE